MKFADISNMQVEELFKRRVELREEIFQARMKNALGQLGNPVQIRKLRRDIARVQTALSKKLAQ